MSRKTHPISHRLGITTWRPSRTPTYGRPPRNETASVVKAPGRYCAITRIVEGVLSKYGYKVTAPNIWTTQSDQAEVTGRISVVLSKKEGLPQNPTRGAESNQVNPGQIAGQPLGAGETEEMDRILVASTNVTSYMSTFPGHQENPRGGTGRVTGKEMTGSPYSSNFLRSKRKNVEQETMSTQSTHYVMSYLSTLVSTYENQKYVVDIREIQEEWTQGTAGIIAQSIGGSDRSLVPTMADIQRRVSKAQAYIEQSQAYVQKATKSNPYGG